MRHKQKKIRNRTNNKHIQISRTDYLFIEEGDSINNINTTKHFFIQTMKSNLFIQTN